MKRTKKIQRTLLLPLWGLGGFLLLIACKEEKEAIYFETTAPAAYTFPDTEASATFTVSGNTAWAIDVTEGRDLCSVTPASGKGDATVTVRVTANPAYLQERSMALVLTAGDYTKQVAITQAAPPCPDFNPGAIATAGQTVTVGGTPATINSTQAATGGNGQISYQWYKNDTPISGATAAVYTPPLEDAATVSVITYTRRAKDNTCNTSFIPSEGIWVLNIVCPDFNPGAIATAGQTVTVGGTPATINSTQDATGGNGQISYQWYKNGNSIAGATDAVYTPPLEDAATVSVITYTRRAKDNTCNTSFIPSEGTWVLNIVCPDFNPGAIATAGQTVTIGGTPVTINSTQDATGSGIISYQWYKNNTAITGATEAYYTPPPADAVAVGAHTYTRRAKDYVCNTTLTASEGSWVLTVNCPAFDAGAIATTGQTICSGGAVSTVTSSVNASGGDGNITYQWRRNGSPIDNTNTATYNPTAYSTTAGTHTFTRWAQDNCNTSWTQSAGSWVLVVQARPELTLTTANNNQTVDYGAAITPIIYTAANASYLTGSLPPGVIWSGVNSTYTISGTPTTTGVFYYTITANHTNGCAGNPVSGTITVVNAAVTTPPGALTTRTWTIGTQTWSDALAKAQPGCIASTDLGTTNPPTTAMYRSSGLQSGSGYLYNWKCVSEQATNLCPSPWRVPATDDFCTLDKTLMSTSSCGNRVGASSDVTVGYMGLWGGVYGGFAYSTSVLNTVSAAYYWSSTAYGRDLGHYLIFDVTGAVYPQYTDYKLYGLQVRCVN